MRTLTTLQAVHAAEILLSMTLNRRQELTNAEIRDYTAAFNYLRGLYADIATNCLPPSFEAHLANRTTPESFIRMALIATA